MATSGASTFLPVVARLRASQPVYHVLLPPTRSSLLVGQLCLALAVVSVVVYVVLRVDPTGSAQVLPAAVLLTFAVAVGGVRRGQERYVQERERSRCLGPLVGVTPHVLYLPATSGLTFTLAARTAVLTPLALLLAAAAGGSAQVGVRQACLYGLLPAVALVGRELASHAAVAAEAVRLPQYVYAVGGVAAGLGLAHLGGVLLRGDGPGAAAAAGPPTWVPVVPVLAGLLLAALRYAVGMLAERVARTGLALGGQLPLPRWSAARLPLGARLWTTLGRERSSVILGFFAMLTLLLVQLPALVGVLPDGMEGYERLELMVLFLYAVAFVSSTLFQEPLQVGQVWRRVSLLRLARVPVLDEVRGLSRSVLLPTAVCTVGGALVLREAGAFRGLPEVLLAVVTALVVVSALGTTLLPALSGAALDSGRVTDELSFVELLKSAFSGLLPACLAVGWVSVQPRSATEVGLVALGLLVVTALLLSRIDRVVRHHVRSAGA